ncbi:hypothetical protein PBY51_016531 [Eleginops maclovinus]|uniref:Uncharacterized protein n=1 Tax=Eleginops maclovinus TaxID=56733 RepID=A0AAN7WPV5_ELEMC|nr:hypothetical protein PBY51_016531 [Eleginops maclovinus]
MGAPGARGPEKDPNRGKLPQRTRLWTRSPERRRLGSQQREQRELKREKSG